METKVYFKMYKAGKQWFVTGVMIAGAVVFIGATHAHADVTPDTTTPTTQVATPATQTTTSMVK